MDPKGDLFDYDHFRYDSTVYSKEKLSFYKRRQVIPTGKNLKKKKTFRFKKDFPLINKMTEFVPQN